MYLRAGAIVLTVAVCILAWNQLRNSWKNQYVVLLDAPVEMLGVTRHRISTPLAMDYDIVIRFRVNDDDRRIMCAIGYPEDGYPGQSNEHLCAGRPTVLYTSWLLREAQRVVAQGRTDGRADRYSAGGGAVEAQLGDFVGHAGRPQDLSVTFGRDARFLSFAHPRLVVQAYWMSIDREFGVVYSEGAIVLAGIGVLLMLAGVLRGAARRFRGSG